jgi:hypothetical protein
LSVVAPPISLAPGGDARGDLVRVLIGVRSWLPEARLPFGLAAVGGVVHAWGMTRSPGALDDEGTYVAQAWAVEHWGTLAHYTYWYDHPPLGWLQIALWSSITGAFDAVGNAVMAARPLMLLSHLASCLLLYVLGRRLGLSKAGVAVAVLAFSLSPLAVAFHRYVLLDNIATPWLLAAFALAASPRRSLSASAGAAVCMVACVLSKETTLVLVPALVWQLWLNSDRRTRTFTFALFGGLSVALLASYPLIAVLKNELIPGDGHVSLLGSIGWQLFGRASSGSILDAASNGRGLVALWLGMDSWLIVLGIAATPLAFSMRRLRAVALGFAIQVLMLLRPGYLPYPYVIAMLPFAALVVAGVLDAAWRTRSAERGASRFFPIRPERVGVALVAIVFLVFGAPAWARGLHDQITADRTVALREATAWLTNHAALDEVLVVDDSLWVDLVERGRAPENVIWFYKVDLDPAVKLADGWRSIGYVVLGEAGATTDGLPTVQAAVDHSEVVASFGSGPDTLTIRRVLPR